jgi:hypothetical protein
MKDELSKSEIANLLQQTIQQLDSIVEQLRTGEVENLPARAVVENLVAETQALAAVFQQSQATTEPTEAESVPVIIEAEMPEVSTPLPVPEAAAPATPTAAEIEAETSAGEVIWLDRFLPSFNDIQTWWSGILRKIRSLLPQSWQEKASDLLLTGVITGIIVALLLTSVLLLPKAPTEIAEIPPEAIETPPELKAPSRPEPVEIAPPPEPVLTPEQSLVAAIQDEVTSLTREYPQGLLHSVEADFLGSRLTITVAEKWYELSPGKQDKFANAVLQRSRKLDFRKLEIVNLQSNLLARNPVVGNNMVILQRDEM